MRVPRGKCRNEGRPFQGIDTIAPLDTVVRCCMVEMRVAPFRALTHHFNISRCNFFHHVEMRVAPFRALTHVPEYNLVKSAGRRNEGRPFQGIDTIRVETSNRNPYKRRNEGRPFQGIDTPATYIFPL